MFFVFIFFLQLPSRKNPAGSHARLVTWSQSTCVTFKTMDYLCTFWVTGWVLSRTGSSFPSAFISNNILLSLRAYFLDLANWQAKSTDIILFKGDTRLSNLANNLILSERYTYIAIDLISIVAFPRATCFEFGGCALSIDSPNLGESCKRVTGFLFDKGRCCLELPCVLLFTSCPRDTFLVLNIQKVFYSHLFSWLSFISSLPGWHH